MRDRNPIFRVLALGLLAAATAAAGCDRTPGKPAAAAGQKKLYWVQPLRGHAVHLLTQTAFKEGCAKLGYACEVIGTEAADTPATVALAEQILAKGDAAGLAVWATDPVFYPLIEEAKKRGVPSVIVHFPTQQSEVPGAAGVISGDPAEYAVAAATEIGKQIGGKGSVAITQGSSNNTEDLLSATFTRTMRDLYPAVKVVTPQMEGFEPPQAIAKAAAILQANPDVVAAFTTTGGEPPTWPGAQKEAGRKVLNIGVNYTRANLDAVRDGEMHAIVAQPLWDESFRAAELLDRVIKGEKLPWWTKLPAPLVKKDGLEPYYAIQKQADAAQK